MIFAIFAIKITMALRSLAKMKKEAPRNDAGGVPRNDVTI